MSMEGVHVDIDQGCWALLHIHCVFACSLKPRLHFKGLEGGPGFETSSQVAKVKTSVQGCIRAARAHKNGRLE